MFGTGTTARAFVKIATSAKPKIYDFEKSYKVPVRFYKFKTKPEDKK